MKAVLMDGYVTERSERTTRKGVEYEVTTYQGEHCDEYLVREVKSGRCELFCKGILKFSWKENNGVKVGGFTVYEKGKALRSEDWKGLTGKEHRSIENCKNGLELVVEGNGVVYRGGFDNMESMKREGKGMEFDETSGRVLRCGMWKNDELFQIEMEFESEEVMIEYDIEEGKENLNVLNRHPVYEGGYVFDEEKEVLRNGEGCEIEGGVAVKEGVWERGVLKESVELFEGWYVKMEGSDVFQWEGRKANETVNMDSNDDEPVDTAMPLVAFYSSITTIDDIGVNCEHIHLRKCPDCCGNLSFSELSGLVSVVIDDNSLNNATFVTFISMSQLESITIGARSFTRATGLSIKNCAKLESLTIGPQSFKKATSFKVMNCQNLKSITVGNDTEASLNFMNCNELVLSGE